MGHKPRIDSQESLTPRYAHYRRWLCAAHPGLESRLVRGPMIRGTWREVSEKYEIILLDAFGVLNLGDQVIPGAPEAVAALQERGKTVRVVSNNASQSPAGIAKRLQKMGFNLSVEQIVSSGMAAVSFVAESDYRDRPYFLVGSEESVSAYAPNPERLMVNRSGSPLPLEAAESILFCSNRDYHGGAQEAELLRLLSKKRVPILLANPDLATPKPDGRLEAVAGYAAFDLAERFELKIVGIGKPFPPIFQEVKRCFPDVPAERFLMVGDTLDTDVLGAVVMGFGSCLTLSGACAGWGEALESLCDARGIRPDCVISSLGDFLLEC
ncbi:MAG: TIGR01459 family HAD-type hydrolase [Magnetococcales bacterium]|nr:TIGR01459 family HAD-type hydrolase [Magnetococcales bacterium]